MLKLKNERVIARDETVACIVTGHLLKDLDALQELYSMAPSDQAPLNKMRIVELLVEETL
ncbi:hypothetical protein [Paenibacillus turpanensis]|uniref:hypothetical protein n=1 Tax=Paenibacillus turpanensis TaxID=2689078 RepID=UPI0014087CB2|nr:hypothetical protein [Paenibacillus turpanensis]